MSMIANRHNVLAFDAKTSKPFPTQRLAKVGYKSTVKTPAKFPSVCASIPVLENWEENQNQRLRPYFVALVQDTQDKILRSLYESADGKLTSVSDDDLSVDQVIAYLESESSGDRLTKERIGDWFDSNVRDNLTVVICTKLGTENLDDPRIAQHLAGYRQLFTSMSKDSGALQPVQIRGLRTAIAVCEVDDDIAKKLDAKLEAAQNRPALADLLMLD